MSPTALGPRVLLRRLREVMAASDTAQNKLDRTATLIASIMVAEVCSIYVMREGEVLELYATEGLKPEAVHKSTLKVGEGLVGLIAASAEMLNLADAQAHPSFKYLPETGEEIYNSFLGVPILRAGDTIGVMVVQNRTRRQYSEEEEEALQTVAMVLAEVIASGQLQELAQDVASDVAHLRSHHLTGTVLAEGLALGHAVLHEPRIVITNLIAEDIAAERERVQEAIEKLRNHVDQLVDGTEASRSIEYAEVLESFRMFAHDKGWVQRIREVVDTGLTAEAAVERVQSDNRARMMRMEDPYLRERMHDLDDLSNRLLRILTGQLATAAKGELPRDTILIARNMGPAELLDYDRNLLRGVVLEEAGTGSHVAIVARALGIPAIGTLPNVADLVDTGDAIIVDGQTGELHIRPSSGIEAAYAEKVRFYARKQAQYAALRDKPAITKDGEKIRLQINAGLLVDLPHLKESGAEGIGLFRTELQFMMASSFPKLAQQTAHYSAILDQAEGLPVTFRTLDIGADKVLPYLRQPKEENPAMGWRAIRMALDRPALLKLQLRALIKAAAGRELRIMFPMITEMDELRRARAMLDQAMSFLKARGHTPPSAVKIGTMMEVPALIWQLDELFKEVDFVSIGSNDLMQFLYATDRGHPILAGRYDTLSPAFLRVLSELSSKAKAANVPLTLCGEMAGRPIEAMALLGVGLTSISMNPAAIGPVKAMLRELDLANLKEFITPLLKTGGDSLRGALSRYAAQHSVPL